MTLSRSLAMGLISMTFAVFCALATAGCRDSGLPPLIEVLAVSPEHAEVGEPLELQGVGFPTGRPARVVLRGDLHRPGEAVRTGIVVETTGRVVSESQVQVPMAEALATALTMQGGVSVHTAFHGSIEVSFAPAVSGAPPVYGVLTRAVFDVRPPRRNEQQDARRARAGAETLASAGIRGEVTEGWGLSVREVVAGSAADKLGIAAGDRVLSLAGVAVGDLGDCAAAPTASEVEIVVRREGVARDERRRLLVAPAASLPREAAVLGFGLALLATVLAAFVAFRPVWLAWGVRQLLRLRQQTPLRAAIRRAFGALSMLEVVSACLLFGVLSAVPFSRYLLIRELDLAVLLGAAVVGSVILAASDKRAPGERVTTWWLRLLLSPLPIAIVAGVAVLQLGSLRIEDFARDQGFAVWRWRMLESPLALLCVVVALATLALSATYQKPSIARRLGGLLLHINVAYLIAVLFLGSYRLPIALESNPSLVVLAQLLAFVWLGCKTAAVLACTYVVRGTLAQLPWRLRRSLAGSWLPAAALLLGGVALALHHIQLPPLALASASPVAIGLVVLIVLRCAVETQRARREGLSATL